MLCTLFNSQMALEHRLNVWISGECRVRGLGSSIRNHGCIETVHIVYDYSSRNC
jgi:hypothetical protein